MEDLRFILPGLGPLHALMTMMKMTMKLFLGQEYVLGSLCYMNKKLQKSHIDEEAKDLWACMDFMWDATQACVIVLHVREGRSSSYGDLRAKIKSGKLNAAEISKRVDAYLEYSHVSLMRRREGRDMILEHVLLFVRKGLEIRSFYKAMRRGDVGVMEHLMELWCVDFIGARQSNL